MGKLISLFVAKLKMQEQLNNHMNMGARVKAVQLLFRIAL